MTHSIDYHKHTNLTDAAIRARMAHANRIHAEELPEDPPYIIEDAIARMRALPSTVVVHFWSVYRDGHVVAQARLDWQELDSNREVAGFDVTVEQEYRRQGVGTDLLRRALNVAQAAGRPLLMTGSTDKLPCGGRFLETVGFAPKFQAHVNQLVIAELDRSLMAQWSAAARERASDYVVELWDGPVPEARLEAFAELSNVMNAAPRGDLDLEDTKMTPTMIRESETCTFANGGRRLIACARHVPTGELAGFSALFWNPKRATIVGQGDTGVVGTHRNRGLGRWLKAANIEVMLRENPAARFVRTGNADSNAPMLAINRQMGFRPFIAQTGWQGRVSEIAARLHQCETTLLRAS